MATDETKVGIARGVVFKGRRRIAIAEVNVGDPAGDDVLVRTLWSGISPGTEMLAYRGELDRTLPLDERIGALKGTFDYPFRYGYSCVGRIERTAARGLEKGRTVFAFHPHQDLFLARAEEVVPVDDIDPRVATLFPLVETALQVALDAGSILQETVIVIGLGPVGILTALMLQRAGAHVIGSDPLGWRRTIADALGVDAVKPEELPDALSMRRGPGRVPLLVEVSGRPEALHDALGLLDDEGEALVVSWYGNKEVSLPLGADFHRRRLAIRSSQVSTIPTRLRGRWDVPRRRVVARDLLARLPLGALATHAFPFAQAADAFAAVDRGEPGLVHAALCYT
jgi:2-desacetyl-2-hydroxyethyl bacteriochlorophyllide A dehydrogenase